MKADLQAMTRQAQIAAAPAAPDRILVIQLRQIGDVLLATPAVRALRRRFPTAWIAFLAEPLPAKVLEGNPYLDEVIIRDPKAGGLEPLRTIARVRRGRYDLVIDFLANPRTAVIAMLSGARMTLSYAGNRRSRCYTRAVKPEGVFAAEQKLSLLRELGIAGEPAELEMAVPARARDKIAAWAEAQGLARTPRPVVVMEPFMKHPDLTWPADQFARLADLMAERWGATVIVSWGPGREAEAKALAAQARHPLRLAPATDLHELAALDGWADLWVGVDGGPRHLAASQGAPTFAVLGPSDDAWTPPGPRHLSVYRRDLACVPCNKRVCPQGRNVCLAEFPAEEVFARLTDFWDAVKKV
jgi:ADP-heptose:LPS heptosyltransferase